MPHFIPIWQVWIWVSKLLNLVMFWLIYLIAYQLLMGYSMLEFDSFALLKHFTFLTITEWLLAPVGPPLSDKGSMTSIALDLQVWLNLQPARSPGICARRLSIVHIAPSDLMTSIVQLSMSLNLCPASSL